MPLYSADPKGPTDKNLDRNHASNFSPTDIGAVLATVDDCRGVGRGMGVTVMALTDSATFVTVRGRVAGSGAGSVTIASSNAAYKTRGDFASGVSVATDASLPTTLSEICGPSAAAAIGADNDRTQAIKSAVTIVRAIGLFRLNIIHLKGLVFVSARY